VIDYINRKSSSAELDLVKIEENEEFFNFMLQLAKEDQEENPS